MFRDLGKQILKVIIRFQIVCFCSFRNAVDDSAGLCTSNGIDHYPVFLADAESADGLFRSLFTYEDKLRRIRSVRLQWDAKLAVQRYP